MFFKFHIFPWYFFVFWEIPSVLNEKKQLLTEENELKEVNLSFLLKGKFQGFCTKYASNLPTWCLQVELVRDTYFFVGRRRRRRRSSSSSAPDVCG